MGIVQVVSEPNYPTPAMGTAGGRQCFVVEGLLGVLEVPYEDMLLSCSKSWSPRQYDGHLTLF